MTDLRGEAEVNRVLEHDRPGRTFVAVEGSRWGELILPAPDEVGSRSGEGLRVVAVTSFFLGLECLEALLSYECAHPGRLHLVAVASDDPANADARIGLNKRVWKYYSQAERLAIEVETIEAALKSGVPVYTGEMKIDWFRRQLTVWAPDAVIVCGCGQIFDREMLELPGYGTYNFHPSDLESGHGAGPQPYEVALARNDHWTCWTLHQMTEDVDAGPIVGKSPRICIAGPQDQTTQEPRRYWDKLKGVVGPMVSILVDELVRRPPQGDPRRVARIDFEQKLDRRLKLMLEAPIT